MQGVSKKVKQISNEEVWAATQTMENGKAVSPDNTPVDVWKCLRYLAMSLLSNMFNKILDGKNMRQWWRKSTLTAVFKIKVTSKTAVIIKG